MIFQSKRGGFVKNFKQPTNVHKVVVVINHNLMRKPDFILVFHLHSQLFVEVLRHLEDNTNWQVSLYFS